MTQLVPLDRIADPARGGVISIGNFDGVHRGHAALLGRVRALADRLGGPAIAVVLDPHPAAILRPERAPAKLTWLERRAELLEPLGIDFLVACPTSREFLKLSAETFFENLVRDQLNAKGIVEGPNFFFGHRRGGDIETLRRLCQRDQIVCEVAEPTEAGDQLISSTRIREAIRRGDVEAAAGMLGRPHRIRGRVIGGAGRGRQIGFPTANLDELDVLAPGPGVYGGRVVMPDATYHAAIHIGPNPTFGENAQSKVEIHLLDYTGDLYGRPLLVDFDVRVRDIARFESAEQLSEQLARDVQTVRERLSPGGG